jgi:hypothetical protein
MVIADAPNVEVLVARKAADGTVETACVDNDDSAKAFLSSPRTAKNNRAEKK